jgi:hypothetical protein
MTSWPPSTSDRHSLDLRLPATTTSSSWWIWTAGAPNPFRPQAPSPRGSVSVHASSSATHINEHVLIGLAEELLNVKRMIDLATPACCVKDRLYWLMCKVRLAKTAIGPCSADMIWDGGICQEKGRPAAALSSCCARGSASSARLFEAAYMGSSGRHGAGWVRTQDTATGDNRLPHPQPEVQQERR